MKKPVKMIALLLIAVLLCGCAVNDGDIDENPVPLQDCAYPDVPWQSTPEQVKAILNLPENEIQEADDAASSTYVISWEPADRKLLNQPLYHVFFSFRMIEGSYALQSATVYFPEDADMELVLHTLKAEYGSTCESVFNGSVDPFTNTVTELFLDGTKPGNALWQSERFCGDILTEEQLDAWTEKAAQVEGSQLTEETLKAYLDRLPEAYITYTTYAHATMTPFPEGRTRNRVTFQSNIGSLLG